METMLSKLQERGSGVGADSSTEDETSLHASNLDLDFDSSLNFDKLDALSDDLADNLSNLSTGRAASCSNLEISGSGGNKLTSDTRVVYGLESSVNDSDKESIKEQTLEDDCNKQSEDSKTKDLDIPENQSDELEVNKQSTEDKSSGFEDISTKSTVDPSITLENASSFQTSQDKITKKDCTTVEAAPQSQQVDTSNHEEERSSQDEVKQDECSHTIDETEKEALPLETSETKTRDKDEDHVNTSNHKEERSSQDEVKQGECSHTTSEENATQDESSVVE